MTEGESKSAMVLELAEEFLERYRRGERPPLKEYVDRHPHIQAEIYEVFPAMAMLEKIAINDASIASDNTGPEPSTSPQPLPQLGGWSAKSSVDLEVPPCRCIR